jgi:YD repeat-containing protein
MDGNRTAETDAERQTTRWEYDILNRATAKVYPDSARERRLSMSLN